MTVLRRYIVPAKKDKHDRLVVQRPFIPSDSKVVSVKWGQDHAREDYAEITYEEQV